MVTDLLPRRHQPPGRTRLRDRLQQPPITKSAEMLLGDFGPRGINAIVARMECAIIYRFGLRRLMWRRWVLRRLRRRACLPDTSPTATE